MTITRTHSAYHLGDNLIHLHFLRKIALANPDRQFVHYAQWQYLRQLKDVIVDAPNIKLEVFGYMLPADSINAWRGAGNFWYGHPDRNDFVKFHVESWFPYLAERMNVENPIRGAATMLFDYPAIKQGSYPEFDVLIINSPPGSGQFSGYNEHVLRDVANRLLAKGFSILESGTGIPRPYRTVTEIGTASLHCHTILMVSTGPSWITFNIWNQDSIKQRIILLEPERVNLSPNTTHCATIDQAEEVLKQSGLL